MGTRGAAVGFWDVPGFGFAPRHALRTIALMVLIGALAMGVASSARALGYSVGQITDLSSGCPQTGDVSEAADPPRGDVYVAFEGCDHDNAIGFVRSTDAGAGDSEPVALPGSQGGWDPSVAVAPDGTLYVAFMNTADRREYPLIDVSHDQGRTFTVESSLQPQQAGNWGDAEYIAVAPDGTLYVAWAYGAVEVGGPRTVRCARELLLGAGRPQCGRPELRATTGRRSARCRS